MTESLRVGVIGAGGWASDSHIPAIQRLAGVELAAVATSSQTTADAAAKASGAKAAYGHADDLLRDRDIDLVAICVRVPEHRELVLGALAAGKHVYCEWPLGRNMAEADEMAAAARAARLHAAIGLQTRTNAAAHRARERVAAGAIGRPLSARIYSSTAGFGPKVPTPYLYLEKPENGVNLVTIQGAHTIDFAIAILGALGDVAALATTQYPEIQAGDDAKPQARTTADHLLVQARLAGGAALSVEVAGGRSPESPFRLDVVGDEGTLALEGGAARGFQASRLRLSLDGEPVHVDEGEIASMPEAAANVAAMYAALRDDILFDHSTAPDFQHAVRLTRLMDDVMSSAQTGTRRSANDWPTQ